MWMTHKITMTTCLFYQEIQKSMGLLQQEWVWSDNEEMAILKIEIRNFKKLIR